MLSFRSARAEYANSAFLGKRFLSKIIGQVRQGLAVALAAPGWAEGPFEQAKPSLVVAHVSVAEVEFGGLAVARGQAQRGQLGEAADAASGEGCSKAGRYD